jgi:hypothetical protein
MVWLVHKRMQYFLSGNDIEQNCRYLQNIQHVGTLIKKLKAELK